MLKVAVPAPEKVSPPGVVALMMNMRFVEPDMFGSSEPARLAVVLDDVVEYVSARAAAGATSSRAASNKGVFIVGMRNPECLKDSVAPCHWLLAACHNLFLISFALGIVTA